MASSLTIDPGAREVLTLELVEKYNILPIQIKKEKLCLIAIRPLSSEALQELKAHTGYEDYELQLVGADVMCWYIKHYKTGRIFTYLP